MSSIIIFSGIASKYILLMRVFPNIDQQFKECEYYCETHTTVNTRNINEMLLCCEK